MMLCHSGAGYRESGLKKNTDQGLSTSNNKNRLAGMSSTNIQPFGSTLLFKESFRGWAAIVEQEWGDDHWSFHYLESHLDGQ
jgi:hypothetical protein